MEERIKEKIFDPFFSSKGKKAQVWAYHKYLAL